MNVDDIIANLEEMIEKKIPVGPSYWVEAAQKIVVLIGDETDALHGLQRKVAQERVKWLEGGKSVAEARLRVEAGELYEQMLKQKSKVERINEIVRIAKLQARMRDQEYRASNL